jgi:hypothetical protein
MRKAKIFRKWLKATLAESNCGAASASGGSGFATARMSASPHIGSRSGFLAFFLGKNTTKCRFRISFS